MEYSGHYTAFAGRRLIESGDLKTMLLATKKRLDEGESESILIFDDRTGQQIDFDFRGSPDQVIERLSRHPMFAPKEPQEGEATGPGRPKMGVVSREVTLLPRHWEWLEKQKGGMSAALRRLVDDARKRTQGIERLTEAREAAGKFIWCMAGNLPDFEEASRAFYAGKYDRLKDLTEKWPRDIRDHVEWHIEQIGILEKEAESAAG